MKLSDSQKWLFLISVSFTLLLLYVLRSVLLPFLLGFVLAYLSDPVVDKLDRVFKKRTLSVLVVFVSLFTSLTVAVLLVFPILGSQLESLMLDIPRVVDWAQASIGPTFTKLTNIEFQYIDIETLRTTVLHNWTEIASYVKEILLQIAGSSVFLIGWLGYMVLVPVVTFYLLRDWDHLVASIDNLIPRGIQPTIGKLATEIDGVLAEFLRGQLAVMFFLAIFYSVGLWLVGIELAFIVGLVSGLLSFIPYLGVVIGVLLSLVAFAIQLGELSQLLGIGLVFLVGQLLEGTVLSPILVGERIGLHPVVVIFSVMAGGHLFGFFGVLAAVPVAAIMVVLLRYWRREYLASDLYK